MVAGTMDGVHGRKGLSVIITITSKHILAMHRFNIIKGFSENLNFEILSQDVRGDLLVDISGSYFTARMKALAAGGYEILHEKGPETALEDGASNEGEDEDV